DELQATVEELETTNEELQSTNEEIETTNEELQSTNEELETMNEELQSTNEELETINDELHQRTDELNEVNAFLESVLGGLDSGVVVLDNELRIQAWNGAAYDLWGLRGEEVVGQHFLNLDIGLPTEQLRKPIRDALAGDARGRIVTANAAAPGLFGLGPEKIEGHLLEELVPAVSRRPLRELLARGDGRLEAFLAYRHTEIRLRRLADGVSLVRLRPQRPSRRE